MALRMNEVRLAIAVMMKGALVPEIWNLKVPSKIRIHFLKTIHPQSPSKVFKFGLTRNRS
ncbi:ribonuclease H protein [Dorcoceras hygrometricum]|uniref:Ribonuclease H protein n=1 Tax=Dorcoceras hygrometricum TaxID=472368 RepID=A0A2Z7BYR9_9LAMI|nr:ribonuclease H protein [Dorcoceras hygrometricum]